MRHALCHVRWFLEWAAAWPWLFLVQILSEAAASAAAGIVGRIAYWLLAADRRWCLLNLRLVYGDNLSEAGRRRLAQAVFEHHARTFCEILRMTPEWLDRNVVVEGLEHAAPAVARGRGGIAVSGHLGNFEILSGVWNRLGFSNVMMARPLGNPYLERILSDRRRRYGSRIAFRDEAGIKAALRLLHAGESVAFAIDQNAAKGGVFVDFLGTPASTAPGAAALALRQDCPVVLLVTHRLPDGRHRVVMRPPFDLIRTRDRDADIAANLRQFTAALEPFILDWPEQYHWQHARWRTRPDGSVWRSTDLSDKLVAERRGPPRVPPARWAR